MTVVAFKTQDKAIPYGMLPEHMRDEMKLYIESKVTPCNFLTAVLANDLFEAFGRADTINRHEMERYVKFIYNYAPRECWGSYQAVDQWLKAT